MQPVKLIALMMNPTRLLALLIAFFTLQYAEAETSSDASPPRILFLGDSLTAGYGLEPKQAYPALIAARLKAEDYPHVVTPAGLSGETSAGGLRRTAWVMQKPVSILVIALGANDGLRGIDPSDTKKNLQGIIDFARNKYPDIKIVLAGMLMPPNLGEAYTTAFKDIYPELASENAAPLIPFLLEGVAGDPNFNLADGIHPNAKGNVRLAETVWKTLEPLL